MQALLTFYQNKKKERNTRKFHSNPMPSLQNYTRSHLRLANPKTQNNEHAVTLRIKKKRYKSMFTWNLFTSVRKPNFHIEPGGHVQGSGAFAPMGRSQSQRWCDVPTYRSSVPGQVRGTCLSEILDYAKEEGRFITSTWEDSAWHVTR